MRECGAKKPQLTFVCCWTKDKTRTWSGTVWGLYNALGKHFDITEIDVAEKRSLPQRIMAKLLRRRNDMQVGNILRHRAFLDRECEGKDVFQFAEYCQAPNANTYLYIDNCAEWIWNTCHEDPQHAAYAFPDSRLPDMKICGVRSKMQHDDILRAKGVFCMGEWLRKYLIERCGAPSERVTVVGGG